MMQMHQSKDIKPQPDEPGHQAHREFESKDGAVVEAQLAAPPALHTEHEHLREQLARARSAGGETARAAAAVASALAPHFEGEEAYAMPPLGLLPALAQGQVTEEMRPAIAMADHLRKNYDRMLAEHRSIVQALERLQDAANREGHGEHAAFARRLILHAQTEEQVLYPTTLLIGEYLRLRLN
jgi:hypothetical protein